MSLVKLQSGKFVLSDGEAPREASDEIPASLTKRARLVYEGKFLSAEGEVTVTPAQLAKLVKNHNSFLTQLSALVKGDVPVSHYPPIQLDHSTSARDTVGRLSGKYELGDYETPDGNKKAVYADVTILGRDNVERVLDGRWSDLSVGVDFEAGKTSELTITPFPAAKGSRTLSASNEGDSMNKERFKKYLTGHKKMSEQDADAMLSKCEGDKAECDKLSAECDEHEKKMSAEADEKAKEESDKKKAELTAMTEKVTKLTADFRSSTVNAKLAAKKGKIMTRLSALRSAAKISPAEIKKMDVSKLAAASDEVVEATLKTFDDREPVIMTGSYGSVKADTLDKLSKTVKMSKLEAETRANMSMFKHTVKLAADGTPMPASGSPAAQLPASEGFPPVKEEGAANFEADYNQLCALMDEGNYAGFKDKLRQFMAKCAGSSPEGANAMTPQETESQMSALAESIDKMQTQFEDLSKLTNSLVGLKT